MEQEILVSGSGRYHNITTICLFRLLFNQTIETKDSFNSSREESIVHVKESTRLQRTCKLTGRGLNSQVVLPVKVNSFQLVQV